MERARELLEQIRRKKLEEMALRDREVKKKKNPIAIKIVHLYKSFGQKTVLKGINLEIEEGKITVIIGSSGSGKSVLIKHIIGLLKPDRGEIWVGDREISRLSLRELNEVRKKFGMCFQMAALFDSMTVFENVAFPLVEHTDLSEKEIEKKVIETLHKVGLHNTEHLYPSELSGGMRKRVGLARAVILNPSIVIYDEPTTGLDPLLTEDIDNMILDAKEQFNVTSIVISHDIGSIFRIADKIAMINKGELIFFGTPEEILRSENPIVQRFITTFG